VETKDERCKTQMNQKKKDSMYIFNPYTKSTFEMKICKDKPIEKYLNHLERAYKIKKA
jgi:hypothetical protein